MNEVLRVLYGTAISFVVLFIITKIMGKKQLAQLEYTDYVIGISIGSIAAQMTVDDSISLLHFVLAMFMFMIFAILLNVLEITPTFLKAFLKGKPVILISDGVIDYKNLKKCKLDINDLLALCREKNYFNIQDIAYAIFETNGQLSVLPKANQTPVVAEDLKLEKPKVSLTIEVIVDGVISKNALKQIKKNKEWLFKRLAITSNKQVKEIALAIYDEKTDELILHLKKQIKTN